MAEKNLITTSHMRSMAERVDDELETLDSKNADVTKRYSLTLAAVGWALDEENAVYVYTCAIPGITTEDRADAVLDCSSAQLAARFGMYPTTETVTGGVIFKSRKIPEGDLSGQLYITESMAAGAAPASVEQEGN